MSAVLVEGVTGLVSDPSQGDPNALASFLFLIFFLCFLASFFFFFFHPSRLPPGCSLAEGAQPKPVSRHLLFTWSLYGSGEPGATEKSPVIEENP